MIKKIFTFMTSLAFLASLPAPVFADSVSVNFENPPYVTGSINGQDGWSMTGPYDVAVASNTYGIAPFGGQSFRISNAVTSGSFGDWAFSKSLADEAGETAAENGGLSGGTRQEYFEMSWDFASAVPSAEQAGLQISAAPDRGDGARMSFVRLKDTPTGLAVDFADYQSGVNETGCILGTNFITTNVASSLNRAVPHNLKLTMEFVNGPNNDIVKLYIDGNLVHTGTSWEGYFNECEANPTRTVDSVLFQARSGGGTAPETLGEGFVIDNLNLKSSPVPKLVTNDFDGNGKKDIGVWQVAADGLGSWYFKDLPTVQWGRQGDVIVPADYNGDLKTDVAVWQNTGGTNRSFFVKGQFTIQHGHDGDKPVPADYDGDGKADVAVWTPNTGVWDIILSTTSLHRVLQYGHIGDVPVPADYDGDGKTDIAVWQNTGGTNRSFFILRSSDNGQTVIQLGVDGDIPVPGDYNGDDSAETAVWRPSDGTWRISGVAQPISWGHQGDVPVPGDYNGDGTWDVAVWQARGDGTRTFYVKDQFNFDLGRDGDVPF